MPVVRITLESLGLVTVEDAAAHHGVGVRTVQRWIAGGKLPALCVGGDSRLTYLLRKRDVERFTPPVGGWEKGRSRPPRPAVH